MSNTPRSDFYDALSRQFVGKEFITRKDVSAFIDQYEGVAPSLGSFQNQVTEYDLRLGHGKYRVPSVHDVNMIRDIEQSRDNRGRKVGWRKVS